jgi:hypothetical protein
LTGTATPYNKPAAAMPGGLISTGEKRAGLPEPLRG